MTSSQSNLMIVLLAITAALGGLSSLIAIVLAFEKGMPKWIRDKIGLADTAIGMRLLVFGEAEYRISIQADITRLLNWMFGEKICSNRAFYVSFLHTYFVGFLMMMMMGIYATANGHAVHHNLLTLAAAGATVPLSVLMASALPDFCAIMIARFLLKKYQDRSVIFQLFLFGWILCITITFALISSLLRHYLNITASMITGVPVNPTTDRVQMIVAFYATFGAIIWMAAYLMGRLVSETSNQVMRVLTGIAGSRLVYDSPIWTACLGLTVLIVLLTIIMTLI